MDIHDLDIDQQGQKDFDIEIRHFSHAQSDLPSSASEQWQMRVEQALEKRWTSSELKRIGAHCRSFEELQMLSSLHSGPEKKRRTTRIYIAD